ncbi:MAG: DNA polymerase III subunit [Candidatus Omnitrophica bacterium]|nr:DNA polymerase III subunit [Candidatus Omnitrophota bacterium]
MPFDTIKGQDKAILSLKNFISQSCIASSYLFTGPESIGKKFTAITLAKALSCQKNNSDACGICASCLRMEKNEHPDLHIIEGEAIKIEDIRALKKEIALKPYEAKFKFFIIDDAHNMTAEASNALLKVLEEPPGLSIIILISSKPAMLFKTIISRCRVIKFSLLPRSQLKEILERDYALKENFARFLSYFSEGRLGFAIKIKDTEILKDKNRIIDNFLGQAKQPGINYEDYTKPEIKTALNLIAVWFRDIYFFKSGIGAEEIVNSDRISDISKQADNYTFPELDKVFKAISDALLYLDQNVNTKLLLSNLLFALKG